MAGKNVLLVEGPDDEHVVKHLCGNNELPKIDLIVASHGDRRDGLPESDGTEAPGGVDALIRSFPTWLKQSDTAALGVLVDADTNLQARWEALRDRLAEKGYGPPTKPDPSGTIILPPEHTILPRVGIWLMPDNCTTGMLEDFLRLLVPPGSALFAHAEHSLVTIPDGEQRFTALARPKALIHTWLAWQKEPGKPLGVSISEKYLDPTAPEAQAFVDWLKRLFWP